MKIAMRDRIYRIIFKTDTASGKLFDVILLVAIFVSVVVVMLDSVDSLRASYMGAFLALEWFLTIIFTLEYFFENLLCERLPEVCIQFLWHHRFISNSADLSECYTFRCPLFNGYQNFEIVACIPGIQTDTVFG